VACTGPFDFRIDRVDHILPIQLLLRGTLSNPHWIAWMIQTRIIGAREEARRALKLASTSTALAGYNRWHRRLSRSVQLKGIDQPRADWRKTPNLRLFMSVGPSSSRSLQLTIRSLFAQLFVRWSLHYLIDEQCPSGLRAEIRRQLGGEGRISEITGNT